MPYALLPSHQDALFQPYEDLLPYDEFSVRLSLSDIPTMVDTLRTLLRRQHQPANNNTPGSSSSSSSSGSSSSGSGSGSSSSSSGSGSGSSSRTVAEIYLSLAKVHR